MQRFCLTLCTLAVLAALSLALAMPARAAESLEPVVLQLKWRHAFQFAGYYAALERGYYREAGLDVHLHELTGDLSPIDIMLAGDAQYAVTGAEIAVERATGKPVVALAAIYQHSPYAFLVRADSGMTRIEDFVGKRLMMSTGLQAAELEAAIRRAGLTQDDFLRLPTNYDFRSLIRNEVDVYDAYATDQSQSMEEAGVPGRYILPTRYGIDFYGDVLATSESEIAQHPERVAAFRAASIRGWEYAMDHTSEIIDLILARYNTQNLSRSHLEYEANTSREMIHAVLLTIGHMDPQRWQHILDIFIEGGFVPAGAGIDGLIYQGEPAEAAWMRWLTSHLFSIVATAVIVILLGLVLSLMHTRRLLGQKTATLAERESYLRAIIDATPICVKTLDVECNLLSMNSAGLQMIHARDFAEVANKDMSLMVDAEFRARFRDLTRRGFAGESGSLQFSGKSLDGKPIWLETFSAPFRNALGTVTNVLSVTIDITNRKQMELALQEQHDQLHNLLDSINGISWEFDLTANRFTYVSPNSLRILGYGIHEWTNMESWLNKIIPEDRENSRYYCVSQTAAGLDHLFEYRMQKKNGDVLWVLEVVRVFKDAADNPVRIAGFILDQNQKKQSERALRRGQKMEAVGQLTGGIAHDFNNILGIILGNLELLEAQLQGNKPAKERIDNLLAVTSRAINLTQQLLGFARTQPGLKVVSNLDTLIASTRALIERSITPEIAVVYQPGAALWPTEIDPSDFQDSLLNLVLNARDAMPGGGTLTITTSNITISPVDMARYTGLVPGDYVQLQICDSGMGINPEHLDHVFEPFFTTKPYSRGTGLGLAMVFGFVKRSGGCIDVQSEPGQGACFTITLPRARLQPATESNTAVNSNAANGGQETILVVDDEVDLLELAKQHLGRLGYQVLTAVDGEQGLEILARHSDVALLLTDVVMPGALNGYAMAEKALTLRPQLKVLHTSGYTDETLARTYAARFTNPLLKKPYSLQELAARVRSTLDSPR